MSRAKEHLVGGGGGGAYQKDSSEKVLNENLQNLKNSNPYKYRYSKKNKDEIETVLNDNEDIKNKLVELERSLGTITVPIAVLRRLQILLKISEKS